MVASIFAGCTEACGWIAAVVSSCAFGSFGVPIKACGSSKIDVNPLVMQSYKTIMCFLTCWLVVFIGEEIRWSPWGIVSGIFWVPAAAAGIYGIRNAGLAIAVGTWSSIYVVQSFIWGVLIFHEGVRNEVHAACAALLLMVGLIGMATYASPGASKTIATSAGEDETLDLSDESDGDDAAPTSPKRKTRGLQRMLKRQLSDSHQKPTESSIKIGGKRLKPVEVEPFVPDPDAVSPDTKDIACKDRVVFFGGRLALTKRQLGLTGCVINGIWGGTNLIPLHYASKQGFGGPAYLVSYATGSLIVNIALWIIVILYYLFQKKGVMQDALEALPDWHLKELWLPGFLAGSLYSLGNFAAIISVSYLGQLVGFSFCQGQILVSGLWGILYYQEVKGRETIIKWFASAIVAICGILWLTFEHQSSPVAHRR